MGNEITNEVIDKSTAKSWELYDAVCVVIQEYYDKYVDDGSMDAQLAINTCLSVLVANCGTVEGIDIIADMAKTNLSVMEDTANSE